MKSQMLAGLIIAHQHLRGRARMDEAAIQFADRQQLFVFDGHQHFGDQAVAPLRRDGGLFVHRNALGKPARHVRIRHGQRKHVAHFVPQGGRPVKSPGLRPDGLSMAMAPPKLLAVNVTPRAPSAGHAQRAHREVFVIRVNFHCNRLSELEFVFLFVSGDALIDFRLEIKTQ